MTEHRGEISVTKVSLRRSPLPREDFGAELHVETGWQILKEQTAELREKRRRIQRELDSIYGQVGCIEFSEERKAHTE